LSLPLTGYVGGERLVFIWQDYRNFCGIQLGLATSILFRQNRLSLVSLALLELGQIFWGVKPSLIELAYSPINGQNISLRNTPNPVLFIG